MNKNKYYFITHIPTIAALSAIFMWTFLPLLSIYTKDIPPFLRTGLGLFFSTISYLIYWSIKYKGTFISRLRAPLNYLIFSILGIWGTNITFLAAMSYNSIEPYIILSAWPIIALFLTSLIWKEKIKKIHYIGSLLGISGVIIISATGYTTSTYDGRIFSILLALLNGTIWAGYSVLNKKFSNVHYDLIGIPLFIIACLSMICHALLEQSAELTTNNLCALAFLGIGPWGLSHVLWGYAMRHGDIKTLFNYGYLVPVLGVAWTILSGYTTISIPLIISLLLVVMGSILGAINYRWIVNLCNSKTSNH